MDDTLRLSPRPVSAEELSAVCSRFAVKVCRPIWLMAHCPDEPEQAALCQLLALLGCLLTPVSAACSLWNLNIAEGFVSLI